MRRVIEDKDGIAAIRNTKRTFAFWNLPHLDDVHATGIQKIAPLDM